jgi:hypothetical protein
MTHQAHSPRPALIASAIAACVAACALPAAAQTTAPATQPSRITLHFKNAHPKTVFAELSRQAQAPLRPYPPNLWDSAQWPEIDVDLDAVSYWAALRELCGKTGLSLQRIGLQRDLALMRGAMRPFWDCPSIEHGPFLVVANSIHCNTLIDLSAPNQSTSTCTIQMILCAEPRITVLKVLSGVRIEEAIDENGNALSVSPSAVPDHMPPVTSPLLNLTAALAPTPAAGKTIARLKGHVRLVIQARSETVEVPNILAAKNLTRTAGSRSFLLKDVTRSGETYTLQMTLYRDRSNRPDCTDINISGTFRLVDAAGRLLTRRSPFSPPDAERIDLNLMFGREDWAGAEGAGEPAKLIWEVPVEARQLSLPFLFTNLPLP